MKKIGGVVLVLSFVLLLSACSQQEAGVKEKNSNPVGEMGGLSNAAGNSKDNAAQSKSSANEQTSSNLNNNEKSMDTSQNGPGDNSELVKKYNTAILKTSLGDIELKLDAVNAPVTVGNFLKLASTGFYDNVKFHRVIKGFMIQTGDPNSKDDSQKSAWGTGGPGYKFADELKGTEKYAQGTLAMANAGPDTNGSQFFIVTASPAAQLPPSYTVFGSVVSGLDVALKIENVQTSVGDRPVDDVIINSVEVLEK